MYVRGEPGNNSILDGRVYELYIGLEYKETLSTEARGRVI